MTAKGQVTIPVTVRFALGIAPGDEVVFAIEDGRGVFRRAGGVLDRAGTLALPSRADAPPLELAFLIAATILAGLVASNGNANWIEGVQLLAIYAMACVVFWYL